MLLQAHSQTVQARSAATRALQPLPRTALPVSAPKSHTLSPCLLQQHASSPVSSCSPCSSSSSGWTARSAVTASAAAEAEAAATADHQQQPAVEGEWSVLNFYHLVDIPDPDEVSW